MVLAGTNRRAVVVLSACAVVALSAGAVHAADGGAGGTAAPRWTVEDLRTAERANTVLHHDGLGASPERRAPARGTARAAEPVGSGLATFAEHRIDRPSDVLEVEVDGTARPSDLTVEARGVRADGVWTEWRRGGPESGRVELPARARRVQVRVGLAGAGAADRISRVRSRPADSAGARHTTPGEPFSARVFATRIGLVGDRTANGDTIRTRDQFVALPSRRGLAAKGAGDYTVRVCTEARGDDAGRCAYVPVWDVGPWNIKDDYWNEEREQWPGLERGLPQSQAGFQSGYNGGRDGFGRRILNPAGIDLADGTFHDALRLPTNSWVRVDYLWTGRYEHRARIEATAIRGTVPLRAGPSTSAAQRGLAAHNATVDVECAETGEPVGGSRGAGDQWFKIGAADYIAAAYVEGGEGAPRCEVPVPEPSVVPEAPAPSLPPAPSAQPLPTVTATPVPPPA